MAQRMLTDEEMANYRPVLDGSDDITDHEQRTEIANGRRFVARHGARVRYCGPWGKWLIWDGMRWAIDQGCKIEQLAKDVAAEVWDAFSEGAPRMENKEAAAALSFARQTASARGIESLLKLARSEPGVGILPAELDCDPWLFNTQNGTVDLRTGTRRSHDPADYISKVAPIVHANLAGCPLWESFLNRILAEDAELIAFVQRLCGYWLTGSVRDHVLPILYGTGANGKSVFLNTLQAMMGTDYAMKAPSDLLIAKKSSHPTERADLHGKRLVTCIETESGSRLAESLAKELTGGDQVRARRMREDFWEFTPTHKLVIAANYKPIVRGQDIGIWRRLRLVPFTVTIPPAEQDKALAEKLLRELPGIFGWALAGCKEWLAKGLSEPSAVMAATEDYKGECDGIGSFIAETCIINSTCTVGWTPLWEAYLKWCDSSAERPAKRKEFSAYLDDHGYPEERITSGANKGKLARVGLGLLANEQLFQGVSERSERTFH